MNKEEFYFDSRDGINKIHAVKYLPENGEIKGILQVVHGMAEHVGRYEEFAKFMTDKGFVVVMEDHLGHGKSVPEGGLYGFFCKQDPATVVVRDVHRLKKLTQSSYPNKPYVILGHSMGSFILRNYLFKYSSGIDGAIIMGTGLESKVVIECSRILVKIMKLFCGSKKKAYLIDKMAFGSYTKRIPDSKSNIDWLTKDASRVAEYEKDPMCGFVFTINGFETLFELIKRLHQKSNLLQISKKLPIVLLAGDADPVGQYGQGVKTTYEMLKDAGIENISMNLYKDDRHELLNETDREQVMEDIFKWIDSNVYKEV